MSKYNFVQAMLTVFNMFKAADDCALISGPCGGRLPVDDNSVLYVE